MTRQVNIKSTGGFNIKARNPAEHKLIGDLKQLTLQDGVELSDLVFEGLLLMFKAHHWPPGNPQLQLTRFQQPLQKAAEKCQCGKPATTSAIHIASQQTFHYCSKCFAKVPMRHDIKLWKILSTAGQGESL